MTRAESKLWEELRKRRLKFLRQAALGAYVVDFVQHSARLVVEVDGRVHELPEVQARDVHRDDWLKSQGYQVMRFPNDGVLSGVVGIADEIAAFVLAAGVRPRPSKRGLKSKPVDLSALSNDAE